MFWPMICGRCYATRADFIAHLGSICSMAGVIAINCGRCCCHLYDYFSDLRKPGLVPGKSLSLRIKIDSVKEKYSAYIMTNRMRSFHMKLATEYGRENVKIFRPWEKYERKMADFDNHRRFTLRCLSKGLVPVSIHLTKNIKTPKGLQIVRRAERALMNERIRSINNSLNMVSNLRDTCKNQLREILNDEWMDRCIEFIEVGREQQHLKTLERQKT